jgi:hypothetical protein
MIRLVFITLCMGMSLNGFPGTPGTYGLNAVVHSTTSAYAHIWLAEASPMRLPWTNLPQGSAKYHPGLFLDVLIKGGSSKEP